MNIKTKLAFVALALSLTTTASFGQVLTLADLAKDLGDVTLDLVAISTAINAAAPSAFTTYTNAATTGDLAVISQTGAGTITAGNEAYINQAVGTGTVFNVASILQISDNNKAYIDQAGEGNAGLIAQSSDGNLGYISQVLATTSKAGIEQASLSPSAGYITQSGSFNSALITQK